MGKIVEFLEEFSEEEEYDNDVYEKIEAPKFVDFTLPDKPLPDDRSWFCLRIGCDQQHEDVDPNVLHKDFVLRVMAARSPNLRLRKTFMKPDSSEKKCPLSAPAKPSKPRMARTTDFTLASQNKVDPNGKVNPVSKLNFTPIKKAKESSLAAKALTTPRNRKCVTKPNPTRSVQNIKTSTAVPKDKVVVKALVFNSPKKTKKPATPLPLKTPITGICEGMKKLGLNSQRKKLSASSGKTLRDTSSALKKSVNAPGFSKSKLYTLKSKGRLKVSPIMRSLEKKSTRSVKSKFTENLQTLHGGRKQKIVDSECSDMEIDGMSRKGSLAVTSIVNNKENGNEEQQIVMVATVGATKECVPLSETLQTVSTNVLSSKQESSLSSSNKNLEEALPEIQTLGTGKDEGYKENERERLVDPTQNEEKCAEGQENVTVLQTSAIESDAKDSDDKENVAASENNRNSNPKSSLSQRKIGQPEALKKHQKPIDGQSKNPILTANGPPLGGKHKKPMPTKPKPFRLRTDERRILREANLERIHREVTTTLVPTDAYLQGNHGSEASKSDKRSNMVMTLQTKPPQSMISKSVQEAKMADGVKKKVEAGTDKAARKLEYQRTTKSQMLRQLLTKAQRVTGTRNKVASPIRLSVIKESSSNPTRPKDTKAKKIVTTITTNPSVVASAGRSSSRVKRAATVPNEPNFHRVHTPKSCTKTITEAIS